MPAASVGKRSFVLACWLVPTLALASVDNDVPVAKAARLQGVIAIDGQLNEAAWKNAETYSNFIQRKPFVGMPASEKTAFRVLYDEQFLYIGIDALDSEPEKIIRRTKRFDSNRIFSDDWLAVKIDSAHDQRTVYYFAVNPYGTRRDVKVLNNGEQFLGEWDTVWQAAATVDEQGWHAEYCIPFVSLDYDPEKTPFMGLNITRMLRRQDEESDWAPIPRPFGGLQTNFFGHLSGTNNIPQQSSHKLQLFPFLVSGYEDDAGDEDFVLEPGIDLKYGLARNAILQLTVNTDFSQTDIDDVQINLNRFSLFFPEKRSFFLAGPQYFDFGLPRVAQLFFSRRIGLDEEDDETVPVPIIAGLRSFGSFGDFEYGLLNMQTEERGTIPSRNFTVGRFRQNVFNQSNLGMIVTHRQDTSGEIGDNSAVGFDSTLRLLKDRLVLGAFAAATHSNPADEDDPDAIEGVGGIANLDLHLRSHNWELVQANYYVSDDFNPEIGFIARTGIFREAVAVVRRYRLAQHNINQLNFTLRGSMNFSDEVDDLLDYSVGIRSFVETNSDYTFTLRVDYFSDEVLEVFDIADKVDIPVGRYTEAALEVAATMPERYNIGAFATYRYGGFFGGTIHQFRPGFLVRPLSTLYFNSSANVSLIDIPDLQADFVTAALNSSASYSINQQMYLDANASWNQPDDQLNFQYRFRWRFRPLSDLFVVYSEEREDASFDALFRSFLVKVVVYFNV